MPRKTNAAQKSTDAQLEAAVRIMNAGKDATRKTCGVTPYMHRQLIKAGMVKDTSKDDAARVRKSNSKGDLRGRPSHALPLTSVGRSRAKRFAARAA